MVDIDEIKNIFAQLVEIDSPSLDERRMADYIIELFSKIGVELIEDDSRDVTKSSAGNLHGYVKGNGKAPLLLAAHMDTVMPAYNKKAVFHSDGKVTSDGTTVLGADDLTGVTEIYEVIKYLKDNHISHRDIELLFTTGEELYCVGAKAYDYSNIIAKEALVLDLSGAIGTAAYAAPTILSFEANIIGKAAHAGFAPEDGINAIKTACEAIARLPQGHIDEVTTANIGIIEGGEGVNIVSPKVRVKGEIRSLNHEMAVKVAKTYKEVFGDAAIQNGAKLEWSEQTDIKAYEVSTQEDIVKKYEKACKKADIEPVLIKTFGGSDNNVFCQYGIKGLVVANSMNQVHSTKEYADLYEVQKVVEIIAWMVSE